MIWDISPIAFGFHIGEYQIAIRWYGLFFAATFLYGILLFRFLFKREGRPPDDAYDLALYVIAGTVLGARLGQVLFYDPAYYLSHPMKIFAFGEGGLASHGALIGILIAVWLYSRQAENQPFIWLCDRIAMAVPLSGCLIRIGNFFNSEILGKPTDVPWAVVFARVDELPRHPVQIYEAICYLLIFIWQLRYYLRVGDSGPRGYLLGRFLVAVFGARFVMEFFKEGQAAFETGWALSVGQWLSIPAVMAGVWLIHRSKRTQSP